MAKAKTKTTKLVEAAMHETFTNVPSTVDTSKSTEGQRKQKVAIGLAKARRKGAKV